MEKNYGNELTSMEKQKIEKQLRILKQNKEYMEILNEKYHITENSIDNMQITNLSEFMAQQNPNVYRGFNYRTSEDLQRVLVIVNKLDRQAVMFNISEDKISEKTNKLPEGEFGSYDLEKNKFQMSEKVKKEIVKYLGIDALEHSKQDKIINTIFRGTLPEMDKLATMEIGKVIDSKITKEAREELISSQIDEQNAENGISKKQRKQYENKEEKEISDEKESENDMPEDVKKGMEKADTNQIVRYFYVNAKELGNKVDDAKVSKNGEKVLVMEVADSSRISGPNRYYAFQNDKMVLWGNDDNDVRDVVGNNPKMGEIIQPLRMQQPEYVEYRDSNGLYIKEEIDDKMDLSVEEIKKYKMSIEEELEKYSSKINIALSSELSPEEKIKQIEEIDNSTDKETTKIAEELGISKQDDQAIDKITDSHTEELEEEIKKKDEPEAWEVPGKRTR